MTYFIQPCASWWAFELFVPLGMNNALMNVCVQDLGEGWETGVTVTCWLPKHEDVSFDPRCKKAANASNPSFGAGDRDKQITDNPATW